MAMSARPPTTTPAIQALLASFCGAGGVGVGVEDAVCDAAVVVADEAGLALFVDVDSEDVEDDDDEVLDDVKVEKSLVMLNAETNVPSGCCI